MILPAVHGDDIPVDAALTVETEFEGGSARILNVDSAAGVIQIVPAGDPIRGWPAWWCFRVKGLKKGQRLRVTVFPSTSILPAGRPGGGKKLSAAWAMPDQAAWSADQNIWNQTSPGKREAGAMHYDITAAATDVWIAWGPMATPSITHSWLAKAAERHSFAETFELAITREDRVVACIRVSDGALPVITRPVIWLQARQHAWESGSSWVARGILDWLTGESKDAVWLREHALICIVPIMDVDRTATGDGGKESTPHDHNRDWSKKPHYPEVAAVQGLIRKWDAQKRMAVFVDLHNPAPSNRKAYFYIPPDEVMNEARTKRRATFLKTIQQTWDASIPFDPKSRSTGPGYHPLWRQISTTWVTEHCGDETVSVCLETAWNTPQSTASGYREVGRTLGGGIAKFLRSNPMTTRARTE